MYTGDEGIGISISSGYSRIQEKINVVQEVLTILEDTMSSAKSTHYKKQASYQSRIDELELQIQSLRQELQQDKENFGGISDSLEDTIQKYLNLENKLLTTEERSHDDYVELPGLPSCTDIYVAQYLPTKYSEWDRLKLQCNFLNTSTQNSYRDSVSSRRFKVSVPASDWENNWRYFETLEKANALNLFRGKKHVTKDLTPPSHFVRLTWYKHEVAARYYVQRKYKQIIEEVFRQQYDEYNGSSSIEITEILDADTVDLASLTTELTIHVQAKTSATLNISVPRRITLYQFDDTWIPPDGWMPLYDIQKVGNPVSEIANQDPGPSSRLLESSRHQEDKRKKIDEASINPVSTPIRRKSRSPLKKGSAEAVDVLSLIGLKDNTSATRSTGYFSISGSDDVSTISGEPLAIMAPLNNPGLSEREVEAAGEECLNAWTLDYIQKKRIEDLTSVQKELVKCFKMAGGGDIVYGGVSNQGKTTGMIIALLNTVDRDRNCVQALIVTPNSRSSKLVQKELEQVDDGEHLCQRVDQVLQERDSQKRKNSDRALVKINDQTRIIVGTLYEMKAFVNKNIVQKDAIRFLILHKADEVFGTDPLKQTEHAKLLTQILYALNAIIKVAVIYRTPMKCSELEKFCEIRLRQKKVLQETVDVSALTTIHRSLSGGKQSSSSECSFKINFRKKNGPAQTVVGGKAYTISSTSNDSDAESSCITYSPASNTPAEDDDQDNGESDSESDYRTLISKTGIKLLGISTGITDSEASPNPGHLGEISHLYAHLDNGNHWSKIEMLYMLDLEKDSSIIFCDSMIKAGRISMDLRRKKMWPQVLHEAVPPKDRNVILANFQSNFCRMLVCTDFISSVSLDSADVVMNFDLPKSYAAYTSRAAFVMRKMQQGTSNDTLAVVNLAVCDTDLAALDGFRKELGIAIINCEDDRCIDAT